MYCKDFQSILNDTKGEVLKEFEKLARTDNGFKRIKKDMHDVFDEILSVQTEIEDGVINLEEIVNRKKGRVLKEFRKQCYTNEGFEVVKKDIHSIFDRLIELTNKQGK